MISNGKGRTKTHGSADDEIPWFADRFGAERGVKYAVVQERELGYRFSTHFHPYAGALSERLLRGGTRLLLAADTAYRPDRASLPESVEVSLAADMTVDLTTPGTPVALVAATNVTLDAGGVLPLTAATTVRLHDAPHVVVAVDPLRVVLVDGMTKTPDPGTVLPLAAQAAFLPVDGTVRLAAVTKVVVPGGRTGTVPADTAVRVARFTELAVRAGTNATLLRSAPRPELYADALSRYQPSALVRRPRPVRDLDFTGGGAYAPYNWEIFFHVPMTLAVHLSRNQRFAEAQQWLHQIFDPTDDSDGPTPARFWKVRPFQTTDVKKVEELLVNLVTGDDPAVQEETAASIRRWQDEPFRPHAVARLRQQAYMYRTVMVYLDNLIAWGDSLFRQDTGEAIDEALDHYMLAAAILGPRPQPLPSRGAVAPQTYATLRRDMGKLGTVLRDVESELPFDAMPLPADAGTDPRQVATVRSLGKALYFCVPRNDKLIGYWDTVADRLFKIHNSLNLQGVFRRLALFEPPIDPAALARATAAGVDVAGVVSGLHQPLPLVRFTALAQKAAELAQEVRTLGNTLLGVLEKEDAEALALLRARHERAVLDMAEQVRYAQVQEARKATEGLLRSLDMAAQRYVFHERQLGRTAEEMAKAVPALAELDREGLLKFRFDDADEPVVGVRTLEFDIATGPFAQAAGLLAGGKLLSSHEVAETLLLEAGQLASDVAATLGAAGSAAGVVPQFEVSAKPWGIGASTTFGGSNVGAAIQGFAGAARGIADRLNFEARRAARIDGFARREREWAFQSNLAALEINQIFPQLRAAQLRGAVADTELANHRRQMQHAETIEHFMNADGARRDGKTTNKALYTWLRREVKAIHAQCYQFAFEVARKAERALQHELGDTTVRYVRAGHLAGNEGLLAGERLYQDVKRMEVAHLELNRREYELTKHVSLLQVAPAALIELRATGRCTVTLDEHLFTMDGPSHYFRRLKGVALTLPCVTGPYTSVGCTVTQLNSRIRTKPALGDDEGNVEAYFGSTQSVVTSSARNDAGLFQPDARDERYQPFENAGVIGTWQLQLPADPSKGEPTSFDYATLSDAVLHLRYTAREGGEPLRAAAITDLKTRIENAGALGSVRLFALRQEFPSAWARYRSAKAENGLRRLTVTLTAQHYPFWSEGAARTVHKAVLVVRASGPVQVAEPAGANSTDLVLGDDKLYRIELAGALIPPFTGDWEVALTAEGVEDAWLLVSWGSPE
jgi:hypothetical protein